MDEIVKSELILGGQRSGKSHRAETLTRVWLSNADNYAVLIATAKVWDEEMASRIKRHQTNRAVNVPRMLTVEEQVDLPKAIRQYSNPNTLIVVDCITLWLTNLLIPETHTLEFDELQLKYHKHALADAIQNALSPIILVTNEIGLGVIPMGKEVRRFVDEQGWMNQYLASVCERVTFMSAGLSLRLKG